MTRRGDDLTGQAFGRLTVLRRATAEDRGRPKDAVRHYLCRCSCGQEKIVDGYNLRKGLSTSCGCKSAETRLGAHIGRHKDVTGQRFGRLTALSFVRRDTWRFACSCGLSPAPDKSPSRVQPDSQTDGLSRPDGLPCRIVEARLSYVAAQAREGKTPSCGCAYREGAAARMTERHRQDIRDGVSVSHARRTLAGRLRASNTSGCTGVRVRRNAGGDTYVARIQFGGREVYLGTFASFEDAVAARKAAEEKVLAPVVREADAAGSASRR